jgi:hypothetical protein
VEKGGTMATGNGSTPERGQGRPRWLILAVRDWRYKGHLAFFGTVGLMLLLAWLITRTGARRPAAVLILVLVLIPFLWYLIWILPQRRVSTATVENKDRVDLEWKARQTIAQIVGGAVLLIGLYFTAQTLLTTQEGQITDRFTKAITQLGDTDDLTVRVGGIYALERIARDSKRDYWPVMEVLTAFVRENSNKRSDFSCRYWVFRKDELNEGSSKLLGNRLEDPKMKQPRTDIQAIMAVIGRRTRTYGHGEDQYLNLRNTNLQCANLREAKLQGARLREAKLQGANLREAKLQGALLWYAELQNADLGKAQLQGASFAEGADPTTWAQLQGAWLDGANLAEVTTLTDAQLQGACGDKKTKLPPGLTELPQCPTPYASR